MIYIPDDFFLSFYINRFLCQFWVGTIIILDIWKFVSQRNISKKYSTNLYLRDILGFFK